MASIAAPPIASLIVRGRPVEPMAEAKALWTRHGHSPFMWWPAWAPDGARLATAGMRAPTVVQLLDGDTGEEVARLKGHEKHVNCCAWRPDGKLLATAGGEGAVIVRGPRGGIKASHQLFHDQAESADFSPDGKMLAVSARDGTVLVIEPETAEVLWSWSPGPTVLRVAWRPYGGHMAVGRQDARARIIRPGGHEDVLLVHRGPVSCVAWSPDGARLATASADGSVREWALDGTMLAMHAPLHREAASTVAYSPYGTRLAAAFFDGRVRVWTEGREEAVDPRGHGPAVAVAWRPGRDAQLLIGRSKGDLKLVDLG